MTVQEKVLFVLHLFVGFGAMFGGLAGITDPYSPMDISVDLLKHSPFTSFFIPCLILFFVIGAGNVLAGFSMKRNPRFQGYISSTASWALVIWIVVQCIMLQTIGFLHILFGLIGLVQAALSAYLLFRDALFPANIVMLLYRKMQ